MLLLTLANNSIVGTVPGWLTLATLLAGLIAFARGGFGSSEAIRSLRDARDVLNETVEEQRRKLDDANKEISALKSKTDITIALVTALKPITDWSDFHERRAEERHKEAIVIMQLIADRLGPDPTNGNGDEH